MKPSASNPEPEERNWLDLPTDVTANILSRAGMVDILENAQKVCTDWRKICKEPAMWRVINMNNLLSSDSKRAAASIFKLAVDRSLGRVVDITIAYDYSGELFFYAADRSSQLRRLEVASSLFFGSLTTNALMKIPLLEELNLYLIDISKEEIETLGSHCPMLKKLKVNERACCPNMINLNESPLLHLNETAIAIAQNLVELRHLELIGNRMTDIGLQAIIDNCHHLETLDLRACFNIDLKGDLEKKCFEQIKNLKLPNDSLEGCPYIDETDGSEASDEGFYIFGASICGDDSSELYNRPDEDDYSFGNNFDPYDIDAYNDAVYDELCRQHYGP